MKQEMKMAKKVVDKNSSKVTKLLPEKRTKKSYTSIDGDMTNQCYLADEFSLRWNYVLPEYPPKDYDYSDQLIKLRL